MRHLWLCLALWLGAAGAWGQDVEIRFKTLPGDAEVRLASGLHGKKLLGRSGQSLRLQKSWLDEPLLTFEFQLPRRQTVVEQIPREQLLRGGEYPRQGSIELLPDEARIVRIQFMTDPPGARILQHNSGKQPAFVGISGKPVKVQVDQMKRGTEFTLEAEGYEPLPQTLLTSRMQDGMVWPSSGKLQLTPKSGAVALKRFLMQENGLALRATLIGVILFGTLGGWVYRRERSLRKTVQRMEADYRQGNDRGNKSSYDHNVDGLAAMGYHVTGELGRGGMAIVYDVIRNDEEEHMALKLLNKETSKDTDAIKRMRREIKILRELQHPCIVPLYDFGEVNGHYFLVMQKVDGDSLRDVLDRGPIAYAQGILWIAALLEGMAYAHQRSVIHRDLKPENVMIRSDGRLQILDFGISRSTTSNTFVTMDDTVLGTPAYMAPERFAGEADQSSDQYALGIMCYEILTGEHPIGVTSDIAVILHKQLYEKPRPAVELQPTIPQALNFVVMTMLEKSPNRRFPNLEQARKELYKAVPAAMGPPPPPPPFAPSGSLGS